MRSAARRSLRNRSAKSAVKTGITKARRSIEVGQTEQASELVLTAIKGLDIAASKGILHANNAARRKSRLASRLHRLQAQPAVLADQAKQAATQDASEGAKPKRQRVTAKSKT